ncbi:VOC family protein [soil metagenome]
MGARIVELGTSTNGAIMGAKNIGDVRAVAVPVEDQDKAIDFYVNSLGLELHMDAVVGGQLRWVEVAAPGASNSIALVQAGPELPSGIDTGIRLISTNAVADHAALAAAGVDMASELLLWDGAPPMFEFRDPDGNTLYVSEQFG